MNTCDRNLLFHDICLLFIPVNSLTGSGTLTYRWDIILIYCSLLFLRGAGGNLVQSYHLYVYNTQIFREPVCNFSSFALTPS